MRMQPIGTGSAIGAHRMPVRRPGPDTYPLTLDEGLRPVAAVVRWLSHRTVDEFPYDAVVAAFHRVGKHHVATPLLEVLDGVRAALPDARGSTTAKRRLEGFLDAALDKRDGRYANPTYLALSLLPLPVDDADLDIIAVEQGYDRLYIQLIADAVRFELSAADGQTAMLPRLRPDARTTTKRCRLGLQAVGPALRRLGLHDCETMADPTAAGRRLWAAVAAGLSRAERSTLQLTMLPVSLVHDEYQFIRVLQAYEATFALAAVELQSAVRALTKGDAGRALPRIRAAEQVLRESAPLFSLVATMRLEAFQEFRTFTEGASAIQSRNYKLVETVCGQPDPARLDSIAYHSVPEVRQRVLTGQATLDGAFAAARTAGRLSAREIDDLEQAMRRFAAALLRWRRTHHRLAVRMLGERTGTGYTEGPPYLKAVQSIPVFPSIAGDDDTTRELEGGATNSPRCPFSGVPRLHRHGGAG